VGRGGRSQRHCEPPVPRPHCANGFCRCTFERHPPAWRTTVPDFENRTLPNLSRAIGPRVPGARIAGRTARDTPEVVVLALSDCLDVFRRAGQRTSTRGPPWQIECKLWASRFSPQPWANPSGLPADYGEYNPWNPCNRTGQAPAASANVAQSERPLPPQIAPATTQKSP